MPDLDEPCLLLEMAERVWERDKRISALRDECARLHRELRHERALRAFAAAECVPGVGGLSAGAAALADHLG